MNKWQKERAEAEDFAAIRLLSQTLTKTGFYGILLVFLIWGPWGLWPKLFLCAGAWLGYTLLAHTTPLGRRM